MYIKQEDHRGSDRMVVVFTTTYAIGAYHYYKGVSSNPAQGEMYNISNYYQSTSKKGMCLFVW